MPRVGLILASIVALSNPAATLAVETIRVPADESTIQDAIDAAKDGDIIIVSAPSQYSVNITITDKTDITIKGDETASVVLSAKRSSEPTILVEGSVGIHLQNLTFIDATTGIRISNSEETSITASVFNLGTSGTAITESNSARSNIENNTFYKNNIAVARSAETTYVRNNIFANNTTAISNGSTATTRITFNGFYNNDSNGTVGENSIDLNDPRFVDAAQRNFHLQSGSDAIGQGASAVDLGAYGGSDAERIPYTVRTLAITAASDDGSNFSVTYSWAPVLDYRISADVTYTLSHYFEQFEPPYANVIASITDSTYTVSGTLPAVVAPAIPDGLTAVAGNQKVLVTWNGVPQATGYSVHYGINSTTEYTAPDISGTRVEINGLQNGITYKFSVRAQSQAIVHAIVNPTTANGLSATAGSNDVARALGSVLRSPDSGEVTATPEQTLAYPALPDEGCFIATAAFGYYLAPQVQSLRDFRDRFLVTNTPGRAFVRWYYHTSPPIADFVREHAAARSAVRASLYPVVLFASLATHAPELAVALIVGVPLVSLVAIRNIRRRRLPA